MKSSYKVILAFEVAAFTLVLALCVPAHLVFQEKCQLFLWTGDYFKDVCSIPGGLADWIGRFLTQFFLNPWAGAAIVAALIVLFQILLLCFRRNTPVWYFSLTLLPAALLCSFYANENALLSAIVALILSLIAAHCVNLVHKDSIRTVTALATIPFLYLVAGPLCLMFLSALATRDRKTALAGIPVLTLVIFGSSLFFQYPMASLFAGVHYYRFPQTVRPELWLALSAATLPLVLSLTFAGKGKTAVNALVTVSTVAVSLLSVNHYFHSGINSQKEEVLRYTLLSSDNDWDGIIAASDVKMPSKSPVSVACLNLALSQKGMLRDALFRTYQNGPQGLISDSKVDFISPLAMSRVYWELGLVDSAQRLVYEAQESIPDFQKSAYCYQWLVRTNLANGDLAVAGKYLDALHHTLFYRNWNPTDDLTVISRRRLDDPVMLVSDDKLHNVLSCLVRKDTTNTMAADYLLAYDMLALDLDAFVIDYKMLYGYTSPVSALYGEALALAWARDNRDFEGIPWALPEGTAERCIAFFTDRGSDRPKSTMKSKYGTTYWYYYFYRGK